MKNVILTGGSGMIGKSILEQCLKNDKVKQCTSIVRKATGLKHPKLLEVVHNDFKDFTKILPYFKSQDVAYYCLGAYTGTVSDAMLHEITFDYTKTFAKTLSEQSDKTNFVFLSGQGADPTGKSSMTFAKSKGQAENALNDLKFEKLHIFRPGYIHPSVPRVHPNLTYRIFYHLYPLINFVYPKAVITSDDLSRAMFEIGLNGGEKHVYENMDIRRFAGVSQ